MTAESVFFLFSFPFCRSSSRSESALLLRFAIAAIASSSSSSSPLTVISGQSLQRGRFCAFGFRDSRRWSQVRRFACGHVGKGGHKGRGWGGMRRAGKGKEGREADFSFPPPQDFIYLFSFHGHSAHNTIVPSNFNSFSVVVREVSHNFTQFFFKFKFKKFNNNINKSIFKIIIINFFCNLVMLVRW